MPTGIPYLDVVWSPTVGCTPCSIACENCWARELHNMRHRAYQAGKRLPEQYAKPFSKVYCMPERLEQPLHWRKPRVAGVCFSSDLFHPCVPDEFIDRVFRIMETADRHRYVILTKRAERMRDFLLRFYDCDRYGPKHPGMDHVFVGVSVWNQESANENIRLLLQTPAAHRWVSLEPALAYVDLRPWLGFQHEDELGISSPDESLPDGVGLPMHDPWVRGLDGVVMGCESGPLRRLPRCEVHGVAHSCAGNGYAAWEWARATRDACQEAGVAFYLKQLPDVRGRVIAHPTLDGRQHLALPWKDDHV